MRSKYLVLMAIAACPAATASAATVPSLSGSYVYQGEEICPAALSRNPTSGPITSLGAANSGTASITILTLKFTPGAGTPNAGTTQGSGFHDETNAVVIPPGMNYSSSDKPMSISTTYSNTANSITLNGAGTLHAVYGTVVSGVVQWAALSSEKVDFLGSSVGVSCMNHGTLTRI